jgi:hypothetical protein
MSALSFSFAIESALYGFLAYVTFTIATVDKQAGHDGLCRHHRMAALVYALLGAVHLVHN